MTRLLMIPALLGASVAAAASDPVREWNWDHDADASVRRFATVIPADSDTKFVRLRIENASESPLRVTMFSIDNPGISTRQYRLEGEVRYENVDGQGFLEMLNYFPDMGPFFSRTLGNAGAMAALSGSSNWRQFMLPFFITDDSVGQPTKLEFGLILPGKGTVYLGPVILKQGDATRPATTQVHNRSPENAASATGEGPPGWWTGRQAGICGGIFGSVFGCLGALIGTLASRGRGKGTVMAIMFGSIALSMLLMAVGVVAVAVRQPYHVYYPLLLTGFVGGIVFCCGLSAIRKRYEQIEFRKMQGLDTPIGGA